MIGRLAQLALALYPLAFRRRYGAELRALLAERPARATTVLDLLRGALRAHLAPPPGSAAQLAPLERLRASVTGVLACWVLFTFAGFGFYKTTEDRPFGSAEAHHSLLGGAHLAVQMLASAAAVAVLAGALPAIALFAACARRDRSLWAIARPAALALATFATLTVLLVLLAHAQRSTHASAAGSGAFVAWGIAALACAGICVGAARKAVFAVSPGRAALRVAYACGAIVAVAMAAMTAATALYVIALFVDAGALAGVANGPLGLGSAGASLIVQSLLMLLAAAVGVLSVARGWREFRQPELAREAR
jgi:hypothetical protein